MSPTATGRRLAAALALCTAAAAPAVAAGLTDGPWQFRGQVYAWLPAIAGETVYPPPLNGASPGIEASDYLKALEFALMTSLEVRKGRVGAITDYIYLDFEADKSRTRDFSLSGPGGAITVPAGVNADVGLRLRGWAWSLAGTYAAIEAPRYELHLLAGVRTLKINNTLRWKFGGDLAALPPLAIDGNSTVRPQVWDAVVGVRGRARLGEGGWFAPYHVDIGGGESDRTWQASAGLGHVFDWGEVVASYRHLDYTFKPDSAMKDLYFSGLLLSVATRW